MSDHEQTPASLAGRITTLNRLEDATLDLVDAAYALGAYTVYTRLTDAWAEFRREAQAAQAELADVLAVIGGRLLALSTSCARRAVTRHEAGGRVRCATCRTFPLIGNAVRRTDVGNPAGSGRCAVGPGAATTAVRVLPG